jgi:hypothetical protein
MKRGLPSFCLVLLLARGVPALAGDPPPTLAALSWMAGSFQTEPAAGVTTEEHWSQPGGGAMIGMGRTVKGGRMVSFEYLRIVERADGVFYIAQPGGRAPTEFRLTRLSPTEVVFEPGRGSPAPSPRRPRPGTCPGSPPPPR